MLQLQQPYPEYNEETLFNKSGNLVPVSNQMLKEISLQNQDYYHYKGHKMDLMLIIGRICQTISFAQSSKGNPQLIIFIENASGEGIIKFTMTQYENQNIIETLLKQNGLDNLQGFLNHYVQCVFTIKQLRKNQINYEAKSILILTDFNQMTQYFVKCIKTHCNITYGFLQNSA